MAKIIKILGYDAFKRVTEPYTKKHLVYCYFSGNKNENGVSWCDRCIAAEPVVYEALKKYAKQHAIFIHTEIGAIEEYHDVKNPFKLDKSIRLTVIPDLQRWKHGWRLSGGHCTNEELLKRFFENHTD